jgi:hypothetical protein
MPIGLNSSLYHKAKTQAHRAKLRPAEFHTPPFARDPLEKVQYIYFASLFSPELNRQPVFKLNMYSDVLLIYRLIPRTHGLIG